MNIPNCPLQQPTKAATVFCPGCHSPHYRKHGFYLRKGFHVVNHAAIPIPVAIPRYRCLNAACSRSTFSLLPPMIIRYCRFFWPCLLAVQNARTLDLTCYHIARNVWFVGQRVIRRSSALFERMRIWIEQLYREITAGGLVRQVGLMVKIITLKIGRIELSNRWYRHNFPLRF
jgi:hypothetical protein